MDEQTRADALIDLLAVCCTCKKRNTPEWMAYFAERINKALEISGSDDRVEWPGSWSNEFHLISGGGDDRDSNEADV